MPILNCPFCGQQHGDKLLCEPARSVLQLYLFTAILDGEREAAFQIFFRSSTFLDMNEREQNIAHEAFCSGWQASKPRRKRRH